MMSKRDKCPGCGIAGRPMRRESVDKFFIVGPARIHRVGGEECLGIQKDNQIADLQADIERLIESIPKLVQITARDAKAGHNPSIYLRGNVWRYHIDRAGNQWGDHADPAKAAEQARDDVKT